jgi:septal ring factor EnvC (AmiA/AmiB activator)
MNRRGKATILFLVLLCIISLIITAFSLIALQKEKTIRLVISEKLDEIQSKRDILQARSKELEKDNSDLENRLKESESKIIGLNGELEILKKSKDEALSELDSLKEELNAESESRLNLANRLKGAEGELNSLQKQLKALESTKTELETKVKELEKKTAEVNLEKIVVNSPGGVSASNQLGGPNSEETLFVAPASEGKVLVVNKDNAFAVINLGEAEGLTLKDVFSVYREDRFLGEVEVEELREHMSIVGFLSSDLKNQIKENDRVVKKQ